MEEIRQKSVADQLKNEEDRRRHEEQMYFLREQNKILIQRIKDHEREKQPHQSQLLNPPTHQSREPPSIPQLSKLLITSRLNKPTKVPKTMLLQMTKRNQEDIPSQMKLSTCHSFLSEMVNYQTL